MELPKGKAYYQGNDVVALNAGRYAIVYALREAGWKTLYLPYWICGTVEDAICEHVPGVRIRYYHVDGHLLPISVSPAEDEGILWVNYFGLQPEPVIDEIVRRFHGRLIIDNTQSFFTAPRRDAWQVYSCRKFFGVSDGSYVIRENIAHHTVPANFSSIYSIHLLHSLEYGTNYSYPLNKENEERLGVCGPGAMSLLTSTILGAADYAHVKDRRTQNFAALHRLLGAYNRFPVFRAMPAMSYPFLWDGEGLRELLIGRKVYVPKLWEETSQNPDSSPWERFLSEHLCVLPIDQRYDEHDMNAIGNLVLKLLDESRSLKRGYL